MSEFLNSVKTLISTSARVLLFVVALILFGTGGLLAFAGNESIGAFSAGVACLFFAFISSFKALEGFGMRAETRAELEGKIREADTLLRELRGLVAPLSELVFSVAAHSGRWASGMPRLQKFELMQKLKGELRRCGMSSAQIDQAAETWNYFDLFDLVAEAIRPINTSLQAELTRQNQIAGASRPIPGIRDTEPPETLGRAAKLAAVIAEELDSWKGMVSAKDKSGIAGRIRSGVQESSALSDAEKRRLLDEIDEELLDIEHFQRHKEFRRPDVWFARDPMNRK